MFRGSQTEPEDIAKLVAGIKLTVQADVEVPKGEDIHFPFAMDRSVSFEPNHANKTMRQMDASGLFKQSLFRWVSGRVQYKIDRPAWFNVNMDLQWTLDAACYYGQGGDWAVNFAHGLGCYPNQYKPAIEAGKKYGPR